MWDLGELAAFESDVGVPADSFGNRRCKAVPVDGQRTAGARIYAGGDITTGPAMVVDAIQAGQQAARGIDEDIRRAQGLKPWHDLLQEDIEIPFEVDEDITPRPQVSMPEVAPAERRGTFEEVELGYTLELAMAEARRCRRCDGPDQ